MGVSFFKKNVLVNIGLKIGKERDKGTLVASLFGVSKNTFPWESFKRYKKTQLPPFVQIILSFIFKYLKQALILILSQ